MPVKADPGDGPLARKLDSVFRLSPDARRAVCDLPVQVTDIKENQDIVREGDSPARSCLVLEGFAATYKIVADGKRQIHAVHVEGDMPDLQSVHLDYLDCSMVTMTPCRIAFIRHEDIRALCRGYPEVAAAFWRMTLIDAAIFREWLANIGRRDAYSRLAHVFCEIYCRLKAVDQAGDGNCAFPVSQAELADATGLSTIHVNRTLQQLRADGLIVLENGTLHIPGWDRLKEAGDFDPRYLHLILPMV